MKHIKTEGTLLAGHQSSSRISGLTVGFDMLVSGFKKNGLPHQVVDKNPWGPPTRVGSFQAIRAMHTLFFLFQFWGRLFRFSRVYTTIAPSRPGFLRDAAIIWSSRFLGRRLVLHMYGGGYGLFYASQPPWIKRLIRMTLNQANTLIVEGDLLKEQFRFTSLGQKIRVVPNGLPLGLGPQRTKTKTLPGTETEPVHLLYLSNMIESKGYLDLLEACGILHHDKKKRVQCDFCGEFVRTSVNGNGLSEKEAEANFQKRVRELKLEDVVTYHGVVRGDLKSRLLEKAHLFVLPTYYPWEGQPFGIIEALAFATPVISTHYRGIPEQVVEGFNGYFVEPRAPQQIADAVEKCVSDPAKYRSLSEQALRHFLKNFTQDVHLKRLISVILDSSTCTPNHPS